jgi:transcriptional regulator with XRE-family HTH domain
MAHEQIAEILGKILRSIRGKRSQRQFCKLLGLKSQAQYWRYESGKTLPPQEVLRKAAEAHGWTLDQLLTAAWAVGPQIGEDKLLEEIRADPYARAVALALEECPTVELSAEQREKLVRRVRRIVQATVKAEIEELWRIDYPQEED